MMNIAPTVSGAGLEKTLNAFSVESIPDTIRIEKRERAVTSGGSFSQTKLANARTSSANTKMISQVM